ncbi:dihydrolipoyl dehydrogenase family protein [Edaphobacter bradus]|uniref:dihydrolipoyl dehydrogenase family protein n=1 Tax=Edaphobacter bradus TaxID=2259016 RepID=UPI0021DFE279|nr:FAD-dependent oxidoreductase [Edaphobacter bradus]
MAAIERYDVVVLGCGEAGKFIAWTLAKEGKRAVVIERRYVGGSCPNIACLPSKNEVQSAKVAKYLQRSKEFGMVVADGWRVDMAEVYARKRKMVDGLIEMHRENFAKSGAELLMGSGKFVGERRLEVALQAGGTRVIEGEMVFLNMGSRAQRIETPGLADAAPLTHVEALDLEAVPEHLIVLGGGYVGLELAQAMRRFGSRVTVLERSARLLPREDEDVSEALLQLFRDEGIEVVMNAHVERVEGRSGARVKVWLAGGAVLEGSHLLAATGRTPNTDGIGLDLAGVKTTAKGFVQVNDRLETTAANVWALGDCAGSPLFTHIAFDDFRIVRDNLHGAKRTTTGRLVPSCMFTDPELARVGLNESAAKQQGIACRTAKIPAVAVLRARTLGETRGFLKVVVGATDDRILGFTAFIAEAGELLPTVQLAMNGGVSYPVLREMIFTHPTISEAFVPLLSAIPKRA